MLTMTETGILESGIETGSGLKSRPSGSPTRTIRWDRFTTASRINFQSFQSFLTKFVVVSFVHLSGVIYEWPLSRFKDRRPQMSQKNWGYSGMLY